MGNVLVQKSKTYGSPDNKLGTIWGDDDYFVYCDNCGKWDVDMSFPPGSTAAQDTGGCLITALFLGSFLFPPLLIVLILVMLFDDKAKVLNSAKPRFKCRACNSSWVGIYGKPPTKNFTHKINAIPSGARPKAHKSHKEYFGGERDIEYYSSSEGEPWVKT